MDDFNFGTEDDADGFESFDDSFDDFEEQETPGGDGDNRTFLLVAGILGAILILALVCMVVYAMVIVPGQRGEREATANAINAQNTTVAETAAAQAQALAWTPTPTLSSTPEPITPTASNTPVVQPTDTPSGGPTVTEDWRTATVAALLTQQAGGGALTPTPSMPDGGFADDVGIPGMLALAAALVVVIFLARRLRTAA